MAPRKASRPSSSSLSTSTARPAVLLDRLHDLVAVLGLADRGRGDDLDHLGAHLLGQPHLGGDDLGDLGDLLVGDLAVLARVLADPGVGALLHHLAELSLLGLGDEQPGRVRADVDRRAEHVSRYSQLGRICLAGSRARLDVSQPLYGISPAAVVLSRRWSIAAPAPTWPQRPLRMVAVGAPAEGDRGGRVRLGPGAVAALLRAARPPRRGPPRRRRSARRSGPPACAACCTARARSRPAPPAGDRAMRGAALLRRRGRRRARRLPRRQLPRPARQRGQAARRDPLARAALARIAERLGVTIAIENLAPVFPGPDALSYTPMRAAHDGQPDRLARARPLPRHRPRQRRRLAAPRRPDGADRARARPHRALPPARQPRRPPRRPDAARARPAPPRPAPAAGPWHRPWQRLAPRPAGLTPRRCCSRSTRRARRPPPCTRARSKRSGSDATDRVAA